jgi:hypothetical protein
MQKSAIYIFPEGFLNRRQDTGASSIPELTLRMKDKTKSP